MEKKSEEGQAESAPKTVEVPDAPAQESTPALSLSDLAESGFTKEEMAMAEKHGLVTTGDENDAQPKEEESKDGETSPKQKEEQRTVPERRSDGRVLIDGKTPEQIMADVNVDMTPDQERFLSSVLNSNAFGLYRAQKRERQKRQAVENEKEALAKQKDAEISELRRKLEAAQRARPETTDEDPLSLEEGNPNRAETLEDVDPRKKPLTLEDLDRIEQEKQEKAQKEADARITRASDMKAALNEQQEDARKRYADLEPALDSAAEIIQAASEDRLEELFPNPRDRSRIKHEVMLVLNAYANADKFNPDDFNAADMTYELGKKNPKFKSKPANANGSKRGETDADGNPEKAERALTNANRRGSSAALNGGGSRRAVNLSELTEEQAGRIPTKDFNKLPKETRERLLGKS